MGRLSLHEDAFRLLDSIAEVSPPPSPLHFSQARSLPKSPAHQRASRHLRSCPCDSFPTKRVEPRRASQMLLNVAMVGDWSMVQRLEAKMSEMGVKASAFEYSKPSVPGLDAVPAV